MANNRIYLKCRGCGETFFLGKRLYGGYYISDYPEYKGVPLKDRLNDFYDKHYFCNDFGPDCFDLEYEFEPERGGTNADRIRAMTDEELVDFMIAVGKGYSGCPQLKTCPCDQVTSCMDCWLKWLREEAKNEES